MSITNAANDVLADIEAADVVPAKAEAPVTLKFAEEVVVPPMIKSKVVLPGYSAPSEELKKLPPFAVGRIPETSEPNATAENVGADDPFP